MKMSEVFNLPLKAVEPVIATNGAWPVVSASVEGESVCGQTYWSNLSYLRGKRKRL